MIFTGLLIALITQLEPLVEWLTPFADGWTRGLATTVRVLIGTAVGAGAVLIMVISFTTLTLALGSPLYDKLSESVEREFGEVPELNETWHAAWHGRCGRRWRLSRSPYSAR